MQENESLNPADAELESALGKLKPAETALDRDRLMYRMGHSAARPQTSFWRGACVAALLGLCGSVTMQMMDREKAKRTLQAHASFATTHPPKSISLELREPARTPASAPYLRMRQEVLWHGTDALDELYLAFSVPSRSDDVESREKRQTPTARSLRNNLDN